MSDEDKNGGFVQKASRKLLIGICSILAVVIIAYVVASYIKYKAFVFDTSVLMSPTFLTALVLGLLLLLLYFLVGLTKDKHGDSGGAKIKNKSGIQKYYDSKWVSIKDLETKPQFKYTTYDRLQSTSNIGIPIRAEYTRGRIQINMYDAIHTLVIGTTGSGKTTQFVDPTIQILSESNARPCLVIADPKGELFKSHSEKLKKRGYRVLTFDLQDPFQSICWNPMTRAYDKNAEAISLEKNIKTHRDLDPRETHLKLANQAYYAEWYELDGIAFADSATIKSYIHSKRQSLQTEAFEDLRDIATTLCPINSTTDPIWERGAKDLVLGTMLAMLEDSENPELGMTRDKFNFYTLSKILNMKDSDAYNPMRSITEYFQGRPPLSMAVQLANQVITNAEKTARSYMGIVTDRMSIFSDMGVCYATSKNEMELGGFSNGPTALFIKIPDEKVTRHPIATMFISQLYKILVDEARKNGGALKRDCYFLLDEFGNLPKIEGFESMITVARSRKIWFILVLQSYAQLTLKYGDQVSSTVKDNCNIHIFLASNDQNTLKEFSDRCGNITVETENVTVSKGKKEEQNSKNISIAQETRPLIYPAELGTLKEGECIVSILKQQPLRSIFTRSYKLKNIYDMTPAQDTFSIPKSIDEESCYYDIRLRNDKILHSDSSGETDDNSNY